MENNVEKQDYLLEVGTEELPVGFLETVVPELRQKIREALAKQCLGYDGVDVLYTPRRLAILVNGLAATQAASEDLLKGPPVSAAFDAVSNPTPAALGFAKKAGVDVAS